VGTRPDLDFDCDQCQPHIFAYHYACIIKTMDFASLCLLWL
jgi:hypothetical protein